MKICFILSEYMPIDAIGASGGNISNAILINQLCERYADVVLIAPNITKRAIDSQIDRRATVITKLINTKNLTGKINKYIWLKKQLQKHDKAGYILVTSNSTTHFKIKCADNYIICRAFEDLDIIQKKAKPSIQNLKRSLIKSSYINSKKIITNSSFMKTKIQHILPQSKVEILYPPIDLPKKPPRLNRNISRIGIINPSAKKGEHIFLALASLNPSLDFIYYAKNNSNYPLANIHYGGWASNRTDIYNSIDLLLVPSVWEEPFGRVSSEASLSGIPVLASRMGGLPETVHPKFTVRDLSIESWNNKLNWVINCPKEVLEYSIYSQSIALGYASDSHQKNAFSIFDR